MTHQLFDDLEPPRCDLNLDVGFGSHAVQAAEVVKRFEPALDTHQRACVPVVADADSTLGCTVVAVKKDMPVVHGEAGLRSRERKMPEEINRVLTDRVADRLHTTASSALDSLLREGGAASQARFAGNVVIGFLTASKSKTTPAPATSKAHGLNASRDGRFGSYGVVTLHRSSSVGDVDTLRALLSVLGEVAVRLPLVFALHPRTRNNIERFDLVGLIDKQRTALLPPQGYLKMLGLMRGATLVLTDSVMLQAVTIALGVPCLTLRENTERPITVEQGTNTLVGRDRTTILAGVAKILRGDGKRGRVPELCDGPATDRITADLQRWLLAGAT